jgi:hypothetical protein
MVRAMATIHGCSHTCPRISGNVEGVTLAPLRTVTPCENTYLDISRKCTLQATLQICLRLSHLANSSGLDQAASVLEYTPLLYLIPVACSPQSSNNGHTILLKKFINLQ